MQESSLAVLRNDNSRIGKSLDVLCDWNMVNMMNGLSWNQPPDESLRGVMRRISE